MRILMLHVIFSMISMAVALKLVQAADQQVRIPTDPKATYVVVERGGTSELPTLVTKRIGPSGTSYSKRVFDCRNRTFKYLGEGDTIEEMNSSKPAAQMSELVEGSISYYFWRHACEK